MTNSLCIRVSRRTPGRVAFADLSLYASDWPGVAGAVRPTYCDGETMCAEHARQSARLNEDARLRFIYAQGSRPVCALCLLPGSFAFDASDVARLVISHTVSVRHYGASNARSLHASHTGCNAAAGDRDLSAYVAPVVTPWPSLKAAQAWARTPHRAWLSDSLTAEDYAMARASRILPDGTVGLPF